jgi:hypothetical protein
MTAFFNTPHGLYALSSLGVVLLIYFFYQLYRPQRVSGLFLWEHPKDTRKGGRRISKLLASRSLILDLLTVIFLALVIAGPVLITKSSPVLVIILDNSLSMRAGNNHLRVKKEALAILNNSGSTNILVITAGSRPRIIDKGSSLIDARKALAAYDPYDGSESINKVLTLTEQLIDQDADIHIFTDQKFNIPSSGKGKITTHILEARKANMAILETLRIPVSKDHPEKLQLSIANFSFQPGQATLFIKASKIIHEKLINLEAGARHHLTLELPAKTRSIKLWLESHSDFLREDSKASLLPEKLQKIYFRVDISDQEKADFFIRALRAGNAVQIPLNSKTPANLLVTEARDNQEEAMTLHLHNPPEDAPLFLGPYVIDTASLLCQGLDLTGIYWAADPVGLTEYTPLISLGDKILYGQRSMKNYILNLNPMASNITRNNAWPVLFANLVRQAKLQLPGLKQVNYGTGDIPDFTKYQDYNLNPDKLEGKNIKLNWYNSAFPPPLPEKPGLYRLKRGSKILHEIMVNTHVPEESDLRNLAAKDEIIIIDSKTDKATGKIKLASYFLIIAMTITFINWLLDERKII